MRRTRRRIESTLLVANAALAIVLGADPIALLALERDSVGARSGLLERQDGVDDGVAGTAAGRDDVRGSAGARGVRGGGDGEGATGDEGAADGEDDTEGHRGGENGSHAVRDGRWKMSVTGFRGRLARGVYETGTHLVTMVLIGSSGPVGVMMNQKSMLIMFTPQIACIPYAMRMGTATGRIGG